MRESPETTCNHHPTTARDQGPADGRGPYRSSRFAGSPYIKPMAVFFAPPHPAVAASPSAYFWLIPLFLKFFQLHFGTFAAFFLCDRAVYG